MQKRCTDDTKVLVEERVAVEAQLNHQRVPLIALSPCRAQRTQYYYTTDAAAEGLRTLGRSALTHPNVHHLTL